jgi:hypothetical protein
MKSVQYASVVRSLMYAQVCTRPDLTFVTRMLGRYQKNLGINHWNGIKKSLKIYTRYKWPHANVWKII